MIPQELQTRLESIRSNKAFELFVVSVIIFSALVIGAKTYEVPNSVLSVIVYLDWTITFIFLTEISIRFLAEERKTHFFKSGWNVFDTTIVVVSLIPIEDSELAIVGRLIRIFRVLRMISIIPELRMLLNSLLKALPRLGYVGLLMFIIFYIYGAIGSTFFKDINPVLWGDIARSMLTLFRVMTFEDWTDVMYESMTVYPFSWIYYLSFIFFTAFAFLNMIIGIVLNVFEEEHREYDREQGEPTLKDLQAELQEIKSLLKERSKS
jgi:voltage-gated sodium channel